MKAFKYVLAAAVLASAPALAQAGAEVGPPDFVVAPSALAQPARLAQAPARAAAVRALHRFGALFGTRSTGKRSLALATTRTRARGLSSHAAGLPAGFPLALDNAAELSQLRIGWGFAVYTVLPDNLRSGSSLAAGAQPTGAWRYAVLLHGKPVGLVTMAPTASGWKAVSFGGSGLSRDIGAVVKRYGHQAGWRLRYVRVPQATADFVELRHGVSPAHYVPLRAAQHSLHLDSAAPQTGADLVGKLRQSVARHLEHAVRFGH